VLEMFAELHAGFFGLDDRARSEVLPDFLQTYVSPQRAAIMRASMPQRSTGAGRRRPNASMPHLRTCVAVQ
jgi:hypothetical protein